MSFYLNSIILCCIRLYWVNIYELEPHKINSKAPEDTSHITFSNKEI